MIFIMGMLLLFLGMMFTTVDLFIPAADAATAQFIGISNLFGLMFLVIGVLVLGVRISQTGASAFLDLPSSKHVITFHQRRGKNPNKIIMRGSLLDLDYIKTKDKLFKDTGGGFRIAGHDCRNTHESIGFDIPDWLTDYFHKSKKKFNSRNHDQFKTMVKQLHGLKKPTGDNNDMFVKQLENIPILEPIMKDEEMKKEFLKMGFEQIRDISILCCDGITHHGEEVEEFIESATPNDIDTLVKQKYLNDRMKQQNYKEPGTHFNYDMLIPVGIGMFIAVLATIVFMSYVGA